MMDPVIHFEFAADDPERAIRFYREAFGWRFTPWDGPEDYWHVTTHEGGARRINGGMVRRGGPVAGFANTIEVASLDATLERVRALGGEVLSARIPLSGRGWFVYCRDSEGNVLGLLEPDPDA